MNVKLKYEFHFSALMSYQSIIGINHYNVELDLLTNTYDAQEQNIAYERMIYWINEVLDSSVLINAIDPNVENFQNIGMKTLIFPADPVDQIVGIALLQKINAIMEQRLVVTDSLLSSTYGNNIKYLMSAEDPVGPLSSDGWWQESSPIWTNKKRNSKNKVIDLSRDKDWKELGLQWQPQNELPTDNQNQIFFHNFESNEKK